MAQTPAYVGSDQCADCHAEAADAWAGSHHDLAWTLPDEGHLIGDFDGASFTKDGVTSTFDMVDGQPSILTDGPDGMARFPITGVAGIEPLQQYLVETEPGRVQSLDTVWDAEEERWYHLYPDQELAAGDGLHWTGPYKNWNARCAECHATGYVKAYDPQTDSYDSWQAEIGVGCEACHGPGEAHLQWAAMPDGFDPALWSAVSALGFTVSFGEEARDAEVEQCAGCHSRREALGDGSPLPGTPFHDAYRLALLREGLYHADGSILEEVYVYGSFLQSKMNTAGVRCSDCHDVHTARVKAEGNGLCTQCHSPAGNDRFPQLAKAEYDTPAHHFHTPGTAGAECKSCHMIERTYMGIDGRRDHSFRVPRPDLSLATGSPNACNDCHADKSARWAAEAIADNGGTRGGTPHPANIFAAARRFEPGMAAALADLALYDGLPAILRATALDEMQRYNDPEQAKRVMVLADDPDPLVRQAVLPAIRPVPGTERVTPILPLLADPVRAVRLAAAREMLALPIARLPEPHNSNARNASMEWQRSLRTRADFPETQLVLGGAALTARNLDAASAAFARATEMDPQLVDAWAMQVRLRDAVGDRAGAQRLMDAALALNPLDPVLLRWRDELRLD
ncbi:hypothetical protein GSH16_07415 [Rhodobacteraceae bacterium KN286]|uniref:Uncharacterized protein n=2 Tax=Oceanomicrobium pacificus TaxID=2692916 RepID=A0A6B0TVM0_9RHOB|nr:hypothetical protein [Oceanomicrobium pacificus]